MRGRVEGVKKRRAEGEERVKVVRVKGVGGGTFGT